MNDPVIVSGIPVPSRVIGQLRALAEAHAPTECWPWPGIVSAAGYGNVRFSHDGRLRHIYTHRISYALASAIDPGGLVVRHTCDNPPCCNPAHLVAGTQADNVRDRHERGRHRTNPVRGEDVKCAKLSVADVLAIRQRHADRSETYADLAHAFGVSAATVGYVVRRDSWKHVCEPVSQRHGESAVRA